MAVEAHNEPTKSVDQLIQPRSRKMHFYFGKSISNRNGGRRNIQAAPATTESSTVYRGQRMKLMSGVRKIFSRKAIPAYGLLQEDPLLLLGEDSTSTLVTAKVYGSPGRTAVACLEFNTVLSNKPTGARSQGGLIALGDQFENSYGTNARKDSLSRKFKTLVGLKSPSLGCSTANNDWTIDECVKLKELTVSFMTMNIRGDEILNADNPLSILHCDGTTRTPHSCALLGYMGSQKAFSKRHCPLLLASALYGYAPSIKTQGEPSDMEGNESGQNSASAFELASRSPNKSTSHNRPARLSKRRRRDEDEGEDNTHPHDHTDAHSEGNFDGGFACPFWVNRQLHGHRYRGTISRSTKPGCCTGSFPTIARVVQHCKEVHYLGGNYCVRCGKKFKKLLKLTQHLRADRMCESIEDAIFEMCQPGAKQRLQFEELPKKRPSESSFEHWKAIYQSLFDPDSVELERVSPYYQPNTQQDFDDYDNAPDLTFPMDIESHGTNPMMDLRGFDLASGMVDPNMSMQGGLASVSGQSHHRRNSGITPDIIVTQIPSRSVASSDAGMFNFEYGDGASDDVVDQSYYAPIHTMHNAQLSPFHPTIMQSSQIHARYPDQIGSLQPHIRPTDTTRLYVPTSFSSIAPQARSTPPQYGLTLDTDVRAMNESATHSPVSGSPALSLSNRMRRTSIQQSGSMSSSCASSFTGDRSPMLCPVTGIHPHVDTTTHNRSRPNSPYTEPFTMLEAAPSPTPSSFPMMASHQYQSASTMPDFNAAYQPIQPQQLTQSPLYGLSPNYSYHDLFSHSQATSFRSQNGSLTPLTDDSSMGHTPGTWDGSHDGNEDDLNDPKAR